MKQLAHAETPNADAQAVDARFGILNRWTFLMGQAYEAKAFLDLAETTHQVDEGSTLEQVLTQQALFRAFLLSYGKCFAQSGKGRSSLDPRKVFAGNDRAMPIHERIMTLRHTFAAHNDASGLDHAVIDVEETDQEFVVSQRYALANPLHEYPGYRSALRVLEEYIVEQTNRTIASLEKQFSKRLRVRSAG